MLFRANQMPPVINNNSAMIGPSINPPVNPTINPMGMPNHFPVSQDVDLRSMGKLISFYCWNRVYNVFPLLLLLLLKIHVLIEVWTWICGLLATPIWWNHHSWIGHQPIHHGQWAFLLHHFNLIPVNVLIHAWNPSKQPNHRHSNSDHQYRHHHRRQHPISYQMYPLAFPTMQPTTKRLNWLCKCCNCLKSKLQCCRQNNRPAYTYWRSKLQRVHPDKLPWTHAYFYCWFDKMI